MGLRKRQEREKTKLGLSYPKAQCPAISPEYCLGSQPGTWSCSLPSAPGAWDGVVGTAGLSARGRLWAPQMPGELRAAGRGSGKLSGRERDEGEDKKGEARPPASWSRLQEPGLEGGGGAGAEGRTPGRAALRCASALEALQPQEGRRPRRFRTVPDAPWITTVGSSLGSPHPLQPDGEAAAWHCRASPQTPASSQAPNCQLGEEFTGE